MVFAEFEWKQGLLVPIRECYKNKKGTFSQSPFLYRFPIGINY